MVRVAAVFLAALVALPALAQNREQTLADIRQELLSLFHALGYRIHPCLARLI